MKKKKWTAGLLLLLCACLLLTGCGKLRFTTGISKKDVLKCEKETMSIAEARLYLMTLTNEYKTHYGFDIWEKLEDAGNTQAVDDLKTYVKDRTTERIQNVFCMYLMAKDRGLELSENETALARKAAEVYYESLSKEEKKYLDVKLEDVETAYLRFALANKVYEEMTENEIGQISDDTARVMRGYMICVDDAETADSVEKSLNSGTDFATVAANYSTLDTAEQSISRNAFPDDVVNAAFNLEEGQSSTKIAAAGKYYFIKCISRLDADLTEANRAQIAQQLREELFDENYKAFIRTIYLQIGESAWEKEEVTLEEDLVNSSFFTTYNTYFANH